MAETFTYDVFISHSAKDKPAVRELAERLRKDGLRVWLDDWEIKPGDSIPLKIEQGLEQSRTLVLVMSAHASASEWVTFERHAVMFHDPTNQQRRFIPLRLDDAEVKGTLRQFAYVDWRQRTKEEYDRLLTSCSPLVSETEGANEKKEQTAQSIAFKGHADTVRGVAAFRNNQYVVSGSDDRSIRVWKLDSGEELVTLTGHPGAVLGVAVSRDGRYIVSGSEDTSVRIWELQHKVFRSADGKRQVGEMEGGTCLAILRGHTRPVWGVAITPDGSNIVSGSDDGTIRVWKRDSGQCIATLKGHSGGVLGVAISYDGRYIISGSDDKTVRVWQTFSWNCLATFKGHTGSVCGVAMTPDSRFVISGSTDRTVRVWDMGYEKCIATLEGHTSIVNSIATTLDGWRIVSGSADKTVRVWEVLSGKCLATLDGHGSNVFGVAVTSDGRNIISGSRDTTLRIWDLSSVSEDVTSEVEATRYTNAKVLLVGETGAGKSGLALRLTENRFEPTISTDGAWATQMRLPHEASTSDIEREIWLWDFAGQSDYRLIHQLFMDETSLAVLVFNPQSENPFEGLGQWDRDLQRAARRKFNKILVAGRCDRGGLMVSRESIERFRQERGFVGYLETSAHTGIGCAELSDAIIDNIAWDDIPWSSSPRIFKLLKEEIVRLRDEGKVPLLRMTELKQQLEMRMPGESFTLEQLRAVVGLLAGPGVASQLEFGDFVLMQPEYINAYAAAVIRTVRAHEDEIGCTFEEYVLAGDLDYQDMKRLSHYEEQIVLRAMHQTFVDHGLCLRENTEAGTLLVFPSYFRRERPELDEHPFPLVTYQFNGMLDEIYATLVVRLHHTTTFDKDQLWRFAADFKTLAGQRVGLKMTRKPEGAAEITVYCEPDISVETKAAFIRYVHEHLKAKDPEVKRERHYVCGNCQSAIEDRQAVLKRLSRGMKDILCVNCENRVVLWDLIEEKFASEETQAKVREMDEQARRAIDNESRELILVGHAFAIAGEAGQTFRPVANSDWGIDGEIEFKDNNGQASGQRIYLQLKSGDSYLEERKDGREVFRIKKDRHAEYWQKHEYPVMLVIRTSDGQIRWMNVTEYLKKQSKATKQIIFDGEPFTAASLWRMRDRVLQ